jgi:hypothetical protein
MQSSGTGTRVLLCYSVFVMCCCGVVLFSVCDVLLCCSVGYSVFIAGYLVLVEQKTSIAIAENQYF